MSFTAVLAETGLGRPVSQRSLSVTRNSSFKGLQLKVGGRAGDLAQW